MKLAAAALLVCLVLLSKREPRAAEARALENCLRQGRESARCLDSVFAEWLSRSTAEEALALIRTRQANDHEFRLVCHPVVHALGRALFQRAGTIHDAFKACDPTCHSGCYHGVVERFLWGETSADGAPVHVSRPLLERKAAGACADDAPLRLRFQCLHGLGHAILYFAGYDLAAALAICDRLSDPWSQRSCYGGVFMENVAGASAEKRAVSATDYHYPCNQVADRHRAECYLMQTSRMIEMGLPLEALFGECAKAGAFYAECAQSIGRDLSNEARVHGPEKAAEKCALAPGVGRQACIRGVLYALVDNTWDGSYALPFCAALQESDALAHCFDLATRYLQELFDHAPEEIARQCKRYLADPTFCRARAER
ncbi:MAG TPA: hypothetical protein VNL14_13175 [Candidatus Acidoferrales bacterium]|nr:hypothetical protein [Candidatus Acidoferrales bacterium]